MGSTGQIDNRGIQFLIYGLSKSCRKISLKENELKIIDKLVLGELDGFVYDYTYALGFIKRACKKVGFVPMGKNNWVEKHRAGIIRKSNNAMIGTFYPYFLFVHIKIING